MTVTRHLAVTLFLSAFLLFCCQPMVGKMVLPSLGGAASVWTTCVLFFQSMLLAGYFYAYLLGRLRNRKWQFAVHIAVVVSVFLALPIRFGGDAPPVGPSPVLWELLQLLRGVALPFFAVSTTAPLIQSWFSKTEHEGAGDPYFLYASSNAGSLLALLLYPFLLEPNFGVSAQSWWWAVGYGVLTVFILTSIAHLWKPSVLAETVEASPSPSAATRASWIAASFVPSALMLAVTTHLSVNLATVPFLWTLPLAVYLLTFILAFARRVRVSSGMISFVAPVLILALLPIFTAGPIRNTALYLSLLGAHLLVLFIGGLLCHTTLARKRPAPDHLTEYYAWIALGGVLGGVFAALLAPVLFSTVLEYPLLVAALAFFRQEQSHKRSRWDWGMAVLFAVAALVAWGVTMWREVYVEGKFGIVAAVYAALAIAALLFQRRRWIFSAGVAAMVVVYAIVIAPLLKDTERLHVARDFFGVKEVVYEESWNQRKLLHGDTMHGIEGLDPARAGEPLSYYARSGPLGDVMTLMETRLDHHIGVVGLGSGTIAAYGQPSRRITFFEIDPQMEVIATRYFSFLPSCGDRCKVVLGDGRVSLQQAPDQSFDLLVLDAFTSDAIPAHLLTKEALEIYKKKLKPDGAVLFHVSNRYLRIQELVTALATESRLPALYRNDDDDSELGKARSSYVIVALDPEAIRPLADSQIWFQVNYLTEVQPWTDDYSNLWALLKWRR